MLCVYQLQAGSQERGVLCLGADWGACPRLGGKHEAAVAVMINMTVFEVMVGRWAVNLEQEEEDMGGLPRGTQTEGLSESGCGFEG